jgi:predicted permease
MAWLDRLRNVFRSNALQSELQDEMRMHLELRAAELQREGLTAEDARLAAHRQFGNPTLEMERARTMDIAAWMETLLKDLRYSLRQFVRNPVFTMVAVASLAIGIGANTAIFSVMNAIMLRALPVSDPKSLVMLSNPSATGVSNGMTSGERGLLTYAEYDQLRDQATSFSGICVAQSELDKSSVRIAGGQPEDAHHKLVSEDYFSVLGVSPAIGRVFTPDDRKAPGKDPYAVLSYDYWQRRFGGNTAVLGTSIRLVSTTVTVIGVAPAGFHGESIGQRPDFWMPMMMQPIVMQGHDWLHEDLGKDFQKIMWLHAIARLKPGITMARAQMELDVLFKGIIENGYPATLPAEMRKKALKQTLKLHDASSGAFNGRDNLSQQLLVLMAASGIVLLIACINVANLLLARAASRSKEVSVRLSIGASRGRLIRQFLTESLTLSLMGGIAGLLLAWGASRVLSVMLSSVNRNAEVAVALDLRVLAFTAGVTLLTGLIFGLAPAIRGTRVKLVDSLRDGGRATASGAKLNLAKGLVVLQVGLSLLVVVSAGLLLRTLWNLQGTDVGYVKEKMLVVNIDGTVPGYKGPQLTAMWRELSDRIGALPGVRGVAYSSNGLFTGNESADDITVEGHVAQKNDEKISRFDTVGPGYFSTVGIPILRGREIGLQDTATSAKVAVINETFAEKFFAGRNPIGYHITSTFGKQSDTFEVIGVARNVRDHRLSGEVQARYYIVPEQSLEGPIEGGSLLIRTASDPDQLIPSVRRAILSFNQDLYPEDLRPFVQNLDTYIAQPRVLARLCTLFGSIALLLAATGLYGVLSYGVTRRTNEIGIRMALGAGRRNVIGMILRETGVMITIGVVVGMCAIAAVTRLMKSVLYGLSSLDPATISGALLLLGLVALAAGYIPAARAARVNPTTALRHE